MPTLKQYDDGSGITAIEVMSDRIRKKKGLPPLLDISRPGPNSGMSQSAMVGGYSVRSVDSSAVIVGSFNCQLIILSAVPDTEVEKRLL